MSYLRTLPVWTPPLGESRVLIVGDWRETRIASDRRVFRLSIIPYGSDQRGIYGAESPERMFRWTVNERMWLAINAAQEAQNRLVMLPYVDILVTREGFNTETRTTIRSYLVESTLSEAERPVSQPIVTYNKELDPNLPEKPAPPLRRIVVDLTEPPPEPAPPRKRTALTDEPPRILPLLWEPAPKLGRTRKRRNRETGD